MDNSRVRKRCVALKGVNMLVTAYTINGIYIGFNGGTCGDRTHDKRIKSPLLYHLS